MRCGFALACRCPVAYQFLGHLLSGVGGNALSLDGIDKRVIAAHKAGAANPTDVCVHNRGTVAPNRLCVPASNQRIECCLGFAVGAVATEAAAVRAARKNNVQALAHVGAGAELAQSRDELFHAPQKQTHLCLGRCARISQGSLDARCGEWEEQVGNHRWLNQLGGTADGRGLLAANPVHQVVEISKGIEVCWYDPQLRIAARGGAVEVLVELQAVMAQA